MGIAALYGIVCRRNEEMNESCIMHHRHCFSCMVSARYPTKGLRSDGQTDTNWLVVVVVVLVTGIYPVLYLQYDIRTTGGLKESTESFV